MSFISNSEARSLLQPLMSLYAHVMTKSSTYNTKMRGSSPITIKYRFGSASLFVKPISYKYV